MLSCLRTATEERTRSHKLSKVAVGVSKKFLNAVKILLLGTGESGKTTIIKQMKILHINGFTDNERLEKIREIRQNIHESIFELVRQIPLLGLEYDSPANRNSASLIINIGSDIPDFFSEDYTNHVKIVWSDTGIQECFRRSNEYQLIDSAKYFLDRLDEVAKPDYIPTTEDILYSRKITTGIHEITFNVKIPKSMGGGIQEFRMFDVGGQRDQRCKWMQVFEGIQAILFLISCGDFDQNLREDPSQNRLSEALELFSGVWHNRFLVTAGLICFLNKQDIMTEKINAGKCIGDYFPEYEHFRLSAKDGNIFDECDKTKFFIRQKLIDITKEPPRRVSNREYTSRECYFHFTVATNTNNIRKVFNDVHNMILTENLKFNGLL